MACYRGYVRDYTSIHLQSVLFEYKHQRRQQTPSKWDGEINNKLHAIKPKLSEWALACRKSRKEESILCRLRPIFGADGTIKPLPLPLPLPLPSHVGISGNEKADFAAKSALSLPSKWDGEINNKLHAIKPKLGEWALAYRKSRKEESILCRLRVGHTYLTHSFLLRNEAQPVCGRCQLPLTVRHVLVDCAALTSVRSRFYSPPPWEEFFQEVDIYIPQLFTDIPQVSKTTDNPQLFQTTDNPQLFQSTDIPKLFKTTDIPKLFKTRDIPKLSKLQPGKGQPHLHVVPGGNIMYFGT
ncbi:hypothetical protein GQR58_015999 [Nymphon striatum]|nr:hypothetical protein GQR58_015999 [Nymphon striatum]